MANEPDAGYERSAGPHVVVLSGLSGGGKTAAAKLFEDLAYTVVDNLPGELLPNLAELVVQHPERFARVAVVLDVALALGAFASIARTGGEPLPVEEIGRAHV